MGHCILSCGNSRSFPTPHDILEKAGGERDVLLIIGDGAGSAYQELADKDLLRHKAAMERYHEKQNKEKLGTVMVEPEEKEFHLGSSSGTEILQRSGDGHVNGVKCNENDEVPSNVPTESEQDNHMSSAGT